MRRLTASAVHRLAAGLDVRSLACLRIGTAAVLAWDMLRALRVADDWWAMQGYGEPKLPAWLTIGSQTLTLQLAATSVIVLAILLALGWRTRLLTLAAWTSACAFQFAARTTGDYHNAVLCVLLFWSLILPTGAMASLDARAKRRTSPDESLVAMGAIGLMLSVAWIYLTTAAAKSGSAWWSEGSAVWLALLDRGTPTEAGRWLALSMPSWIWPVLTNLVIAVEWLAPVVLLWQRTRAAAVIGLALLHLSMWPLLALGSFPLVMVIAVTALMPGSCWDRLGWQQRQPPAPRPATASRRRPRIVAASMVLALVITAEGERVVAWDGDTVWPYPGARHIARVRYLLGMEVFWGMYAPEPFRQTGWWVAVAWRADGTVIDPITGARPVLQPPSPAAPDAMLRWLALSDAPWLDNGWGIQHAYRDLLLERRNGTGSQHLQRLALIWVHEPLMPFDAPAPLAPVLALSWPQDAVAKEDVEAIIGASLELAAYDEDTGALRLPPPLSSSAQSLP